MNNQIQISANDVGKEFQEQTTTAFENLNFEIPVGQFCSVIGPSGCGKTTLLRVIGGLEKPTKGQLRINGIEGREPRFGMIFQQNDLFPWMSLRRNIEFLLENNPTIGKKEQQQIAADYLDRVGLSKFADFFPHEVSGGMQQRVSIARCFANNADILLMDEPFVFLDYQTKMELHDLLLEIWTDSGKTILFVSHDVEEAVFLSDRVLFLSDHPGTLREDISIAFERPRHIEKLKNNSEFNQLVIKLTGNIKRNKLMK